ncbi:MAG TPA: Crp/Fnr family transcriptional regulator [Candidatus Angelobacter sp.]|nr:Crp/Fnr family transcriptional regulator [Candidatus Angelobacter sp.]
MATSAAKSNPLIATLRRVPLFTDLSDAELRLVGDRATLRRYDSGEIIFSEGDRCLELFIVQEGSVKILKSAANGRRQLLSVERAGNTLLELSVFDGNPYPATAEAVMPSVLLCVEASRFRGICQQSPDVALKVIKVLGHRLRRMAELIEELSFSTVRGRLVSHLLRLAQENGRQSTRGIVVDLFENNEELAARLGTVRELVSRNLGRLHNDGLIEVRRRLVIIPNLAALRNELAAFPNLR